MTRPRMTYRPRTPETPVEVHRAREERRSTRGMNGKGYGRRGKTSEESRYVSTYTSPGPPGHSHPSLGDPETVPVGSGSETSFGDQEVGWSSKISGVLELRQGFLPLRAPVPVPDPGRTGTVQGGGKDETRRTPFSTPDWGYRREGSEGSRRPKSNPTR